MTLTFALTGQCLSGKNHMQISRNGKHYPLPRWAQWRDDMVRQIRDAHPHLHLDMPLKATIVLTHGDKRKRDLAGMLDAIGHVLERAGVVTDDSLIVHCEMQTNLPPCKALAGVTIRLETL